MQVKHWAMISSRNHCPQTATATAYASFKLNSKLSRNEFFLLLKGHAFSQVEEKLQVKQTRVNEGCVGEFKYIYIYFF